MRICCHIYTLQNERLFYGYYSNKTTNSTINKTLWTNYFNLFKNTQPLCLTDFSSWEAGRETNWVGNSIFWWLSFRQMLYMWYFMDISYFIFCLNEFSIALLILTPIKYHFEVHIHRSFAMRVPRREPSLTSREALPGKCVYLYIHVYIYNIYIQ